MATVLVVRAHPLTSAHSRSMQMTDAFVEAYRESHPDDQIQELLLYEVSVPEIDLDLLSAWRKLGSGIPFSDLSESEQNKMTLFNGLTAQFQAADKIVIANPLWNLNVPTRLKAWIDTVCVAGKTFRYSESGSAVGLITGKKALHLQTSGGHFHAQDPACTYVRTMFTFLGITDFHEITAEGMDHEPDNAQAIMEAAFEQVRELAKTF